MLYFKIWNATFERCAIVTEDEFGNAPHSSFIVWFLVLFFFPPKGKINKYQRKLIIDWSVNAGRYIDSCWCASSTAVTQTATYCHLRGRLAMFRANTKWERGIWYYFLICPSCKYLSWSEYLLALKQRWPYVNFVFACSKYIKWIVKLYMHILTKKEFRVVYEIIELLISYLMEIRWHGNGKKNNGMGSHCIF